MTDSRLKQTPFAGQLDHCKMAKLLGYQLARASIPTDRLFKKHIGSSFQLNKVEFTIVMLVSSNQEVTPKRLSNAINVPSPNLTLILDRLEDQGILVRRRSTLDRRVQHVTLTRKGSTLARKADMQSNSMETELLSHLTFAERAMLFELLEKVATHRRI